jgi:CheY-like chemotaxis protein/two-component sensor histidine kinase
MRTAAETMMQIINAILDDSKIEAGKMDLVSEPFEVRRLMEDVAQLYAGAAESKQIELICRTETSVPRVAVGDVLRLRQVLGNLLSNAVKYTERGEVQIRAAADEPRDGSCRLHFSVADSGPGIPESQHATVFQAFTQLENATRIGGTGLGLSIANRLVKLMGGDCIELRSEPGHGSTFSFVLPFEVSDESASDTVDNSEFAGLRVLVVDDSSSSYMQLEETLNEWSADVTVVNRGRVMLERLRSAALRGSPFDLVLIDHSLPDMTAAEMLHALRTDPATASTYVVLMTALTFEADDADSGSIEPDECIPKPVPLELLRRCLQTARTPRVNGVAMASGDLRARGPQAVLLGLDVLVADDNAVNREVAVAMLEDRGCKVAVAAEGRAGRQPGVGSPLRRDPDGLSDAGHGRFQRGDGDPSGGEQPRHAADADCRADCECDGEGSRALYRCGNGPLPVEAVHGRPARERAAADCGGTRHVADADGRRAGVDASPCR